MDELREKVRLASKRCSDASRTNDVKKIGVALVELSACVEVIAERLEGKRDE